MPSYIFMILVVFLPGIKAINVTNSGYTQDIVNMKKELISLRKYMSTMNSTIQSMKTDIVAKDRLIKNMNITIQEQQRQVTMLNSSIQVIKSEGVAKDKLLSVMNLTTHGMIKEQQKEITYMNSTVSRHYQFDRAMFSLHKSALERLAKMVTSFNATLERQNEDLIQVNSSHRTTIKSQQQDIEFLNSSIQNQQHELTALNKTCMTSLDAQQQNVASMNATLWEQHYELGALNESNNLINDLQRTEITLINVTIQNILQESASMNAIILQQSDELRTLNLSLQMSIQNSTIVNRMLKLTEETVNRSNAAQEVVLHDLVSNLNILRNLSQLQVGRMNDSIRSISKQVHYTSLSFLDVQKIVASLETSTEKFSKNLSMVWNQMTSHGNDIQNIQSDAAKIVAFTVSSTNDLSNRNVRTIVYDKVITNIGNSYDSNTGIFTCRFPGNYVFTWSTLSGSDTQACIAFIYRNGDKLTESYSYEANGGFNEQSSNTIILTLAVGDTVWIQTTTGALCHGYPFTAFSGWKI